jgi:hypothetical protein
MFDHVRTTATVKESVRGLSQPTLSIFPVGGNQSTRRKPTTHDFRSALEGNLKEINFEGNVKEILEEQRKFEGNFTIF